MAQLTKEQTTRFYTFVGLLILIIAASLVVLSLFRVFGAYEQLTNWQSASGTIVGSVGKEPYAARNLCAFYIEQIRYQVNKQLLISQTDSDCIYSFSFTTPDVGKQVVVLYNPRNPSEIALQQVANHTFILGGLLDVLVTTMLISFGIWWLIKLRRMKF